MLYIVNSIEIPVSFSKAIAGMLGCRTHWFNGNGHNAVVFFLTTPILGLMYYFQSSQQTGIFLPSLLYTSGTDFIYIWAVRTTPLYIQHCPTGAQSLEHWVFSIMLIAPSWVVC